MTGNWAMLRRAAPLATVIFAALTCAASGQTGGLPYETAYVDAVTNSQTITQSGYVSDLTVIATSNSDLIWKDASQTEVLMATFTSWSGYNRGYDGTGGRPTVWATAAPELYNFHQTAGTSAQDMALRTKQLLGMPRSSTNDRVVEFYVKPGSLFRPTKNVDITGPNSSWNNTFPPQWNPAAEAYQKTWFNNNLSTYNPASGDPYPWTQLGYTYDWGNSDSIVGLTEFLAYQNVPGGETYEDNPIEVLAVVSIESYAYYDRNGNFDITGTCDTVWGGSLYVPLDATNGNWLKIHEGAVISGGEGITFASLAEGGAADYRVENRGTILGRAVNADGSYRDSSLLFPNEGRFVNYGTVTGDLIGLSGTFASGTSGWTAPTLTIDNAAGATLAGFQYAVKTADTADTITNAGTLRGDVETGGANDQIQNTGLVEGSIDTGAGDDAIESVGGHISGDIDGGEGTDALTLAGADGEFVFERDIENVEGVTIAAGDAVRLNGSISGDVTVQSGAQLGGTGWYAGDVTTQSGGVMTPGGSIGAIQVAGDYVQSAGSTYEAEICKPNENSSNMCDKIAVTGSATLSGSTIDVQYGGGKGRVITTGDTYNILSAEGGITGSPTVSTGAGFLSFSGAEASGTFSVTASRTATFESAAEGINDTAVARALDADLPAADAYYGDMINRWSFRSAAAFASGVGRLGPQPYLASQASATRLSHFLNGRVAAHLANRRMSEEVYFGGRGGDGTLFGGFAHTPYSIRRPAFWETPARSIADGGPTSSRRETVASGPHEIESTVVRRQNACCPTTALWFQPLGTFFDQPTDDRQIGFRANTTGAQVGIDQQISDDVVFGYLFDYAYSDLTFLDQYGVGHTNLYRGGLYSSTRCGRWYFDSLVAYGYGENMVKRVVDLSLGQTTQGDYASHEASVYWGTGLDLTPWLQPTFSIEYLYRHQLATTERGATGAELYLPSDDAHSLYSRLGLRCARAYYCDTAVYTPEFTAGWAREYLDDDALQARFLGGTHAMVLDRVNAMRDAAYLGAGLTVEYASLCSLVFRYEGQFSGAGQFNAAEVGFAKRF